MSDNDCINECKSSKLYSIYYLLNNLITHKNYQIDENRKISKRIDDIEKRLNSLT
jgi:hypothetical protein